MTTRTHSNELPRETHIGRTALRVRDLDEMMGFYRDVVGLGILSQSDDATILGVADTPLLILEESEDALERHSSSAGLFHNAFRVPSREALGDALVRIREHWQLGGAADHDVSEALYLTDPEGNGIEIYRDYPRDEWPYSDDGTVHMGTYALDLEPIAAAATGDPNLPDGTDVGHVHLEVSSLEEFRDFYVDLIGFEAQITVPAALFVSASGYHHHLGANTWSRRSKPASGRGISWFEIVVPDTAVLTEIQARIEDSEYPVFETEDGISVIGPDEIEVRLRA
ncbi:MULTISPECIES: VOC family protein [Halobacterium]|uniref:VOC family protein n=1 Tax=Halobacterium TaxID=2239 RepID=UPI00073F2CC5|nr:MULTISPECIES: VOC family protein [Halobacterium]MCG1004822.1 VOC family protein [Halobacterium noricense]